MIKDASLVTQQAAKKPKVWESMMSELQTFFLYASLTKCSEPADSVSDTLRKILEVEGTATAVSCLELLLMSKFNCQLSTPALLVTNIRVGAFSGAPVKKVVISASSTSLTLPTV